MGDAAKLAIDGGQPVRDSMLPYGRHAVTEDDIAAVTSVLRSAWLTGGPKVADFERAFAAKVGSRHASAVSSGTAALHAAMFAIELTAGDEVIVPAMTFAATANAVVFEGGCPVFADVEPDTLLIDADSVSDKITARSRAVIAVDYAGQPCDYDRLRAVADRHGIAVVADACHSLGAAYHGRPVGSLADLSTFSLHPVKHVTAGEGGVVTTDDSELIPRLEIFRNHGMSADHAARDRADSWYYEIRELGYNYRLSDFQCALAMSQLSRLDEQVSRRREIARAYDRAFASLDGIRQLATRPDCRHAYHLYVVRLDLDRFRDGRRRVFQALRAEGIGVNVHYIPVHLHPLYRSRFGTGPGLCPVAEAAYEEIITLPMFPAMTDRDVQDVIDAVVKVHKAYR